MMDHSHRQLLISLVRERSLAALGTLNEGSPVVSMVLYASEPDLSCLYLHVSRLAQHTSGLLAQPRVGLLISQPDRASRNPLTLARVSLQGLATRLQEGTPTFERACDRYVNVHPTTAINFQLPDFLLFGVYPESARFIAGFGKIFDFDRKSWASLAALGSAPNTDFAPPDRAST
jgi:putative heme iron utilization protein